MSALYETKRIAGYPHIRIACSKCHDRMWVGWDGKIIPRGQCEDCYSGPAKLRIRAHCGSPHPSIPRSSMQYHGSGRAIGYDL